MRTAHANHGFSLVEFLIASTITLTIMGVAFSTFQDTLALNQTTIQVADSNQNLRAGANLLVRDLMQTGRNLPLGGISIPSGAGSTAINRPARPGQSLTFNNVTATTLSSITTGANLGPTVDGRVTDLITLLTDDPFMDDLTLNPSTTSGNVPKLAANGASFSLGGSAAWLAGSVSDGVAPIAPGDLIYFSNAIGSAIQTVTRVVGATVYFDAGDAFNFNQRNADSGSITQILGVQTTVRRVLMYTYYVTPEAPGLPRLVRALNFGPPQALAGIIEDLEFTYDLVDGVYNPSNIESLPYTANDVTYSANQIRKVNLHVGVRAEEKSKKTNDYPRNHLSTTVSIRNLAYVDRYQ